MLNLVPTHLTWPHPSKIPLMRPKGIPEYLDILLVGDSCIDDSWIWRHHANYNVRENTWCWSGLCGSGIVCFARWYRSGRLSGGVSVEKGAAGSVVTTLTVLWLCGG